MDIETQNIDHLGLVAAMCDEIGIVDIVDSACGEQAINKNLTYGQCVKCMLLNGLGFVGRTLYLYSEYFEDKPVSHLLGTSVEPEKIDDNVLGRTLDKLFSLGVTELYTRIALKAMQKLGIDVKSLHLDSTSFHTDGEYNSLLEQSESCIQITKGYSRDHRPELNQVVLQMITSNQGSLPLFMQAASGNTSDKSAFSEIIKEHLKCFQAAVGNRYFVGDSALYTPQVLTELQGAGAFFVTRVPGQLNLEKSMIEKSSLEQMKNLGDGYFAQEFSLTCSGVNQRWVVVFSEAAHARECRTLVKNFKKGSEKEVKAFEKLCKEVFSCPGDAKKQFSKMTSKFKYSSVKDFEVFGVEKYPTAGRPKKEETPKLVGYQIRANIFTSLETKSLMEKKKGYFVLATNDLSWESFPMEEVLRTYKSQQSVERGFRFLKSPDFLVSSFFLKKPERIESLLMIMTLCLLVYSSIEYKVRRELKEQGEFFLDQKKKPTQKPTSRWIFFCFLGLHMIFLNKEKYKVGNLKERHRIILRCLGPPFQKIYYSEMW